MKDKAVTYLFNAMSLCVWAATIGIIIFAVVLLCTGMEKDQEFTLRGACLSEALAADDAVLAEHGKTGADWYRLDLELTVAGPRLSPYSYTAEDIRLYAPGGLGESFTVVNGTLDYSKVSPADVTLSVYVRSPQGRQAIAERVKDMKFELNGVVGRFSFIKYPFKWKPDFALASFALPDFAAQDDAA